jgi:parallel beta helix pectate lyase-like protein
VLRTGTYSGTFSASADGTQSRPIQVCGSSRAIIDGGGIHGAPAIELDGASHWTLRGFQVRHAQKGVMVDHATDVTIDGLTVSGIGDEGIHLRNGTTHSRVTGSTISRTGLREAKYGEGIYIGSARSNWCTVSNCKPDRSDDDLIAGNRISATSAESVDIKEGTSGGTLRGNTFDGSGMSGADSWVDVKGNGWTISGNSGTDSPQDGFQTHSVVDGWGDDNRFTGNTARVNGDGYAFHLTPSLGNVVDCDNHASGADEGLANVRCS